MRPLVLTPFGIDIILATAFFNHLIKSLGKLMKGVMLYLNLSKVTLISPVTASLRVQIRSQLTLTIIYLAPPPKTQLSVLSHWKMSPFPLIGVTQDSHPFFSKRSLCIETFDLQ